MRWMLSAGSFVAVLLVPPLALAQDSKLAAPAAISVTPAEFAIGCADDVQRLLVTAKAADGRTIDYSRKATYASSDAKVAKVSPEGVVVPRGNGKAEVRIAFAGRDTVAKVTVKDFGVEPPVSFRNQVVPIFTKLGCNAGGCHGKASGQNGFKLSLLGFDPDFDFAAVVKEGRGRRVFPAAPDRSLLLLKAAGAVPHGGGQRLEPRLVGIRACCCRWIRAGHAAPAPPTIRSWSRIEVLPASRPSSAAQCRAAGARHGVLLRRHARAT